MVDQEKVNRANREMILTLSVNLQEAQLLSLAIEKGSVSVVLRNPEDQRTIAGIPDMSSTALTNEEVRRQVQSKSNRPVRLEAE